MRLKNLKSFARHLLNSKLYTTVTVIGFTISLTFVILLSVYIKNELSVNALQKNKERIFRLTNENYGSFAPPVGLWLQTEFPEIECYTRISDNNGVLITSDNVKVKFNYLLADSTFFHIFSFKLIEGDLQTALKTRNSVVLSQEFANKLFGQESPLNKQITIDGIPCMVDGVVEDISKKSNFSKCDAIINFRSQADFWRWPDLLTSFGNSSFGLYFLAKPNTDLPSKAAQVLELFKKDYWMYQNERTKTVVFEPLMDNYFSAQKGRGIEHNSQTLITILFAIVILILVLAIINYMNLTIAQSGMRAKEIAIKKLHGSSRQKLIVQHVIESISLCLIALVLAVLGSFLAEPILNDLLKTQLNLSGQFTTDTLALTLLFVVVVGVVSGIVPASIITRLQAVEVIKGGFRRKNKSVYSKILIAFQYTVVIILVIATILISKQTAFMRNFDPGFNTTNIVWFDNNINPTEIQSFKNEMSKIPGVKRVSFVQGTPIDGGNNQSFIYNDKPVSFQEFVVDSSFFPMMGMHITSTGTSYSTEGIWLNQITISKLGLDSLPQSFQFHNKEIPVLGIVDNFNFRSLHTELGMVMIRQLGKEEYPWKILVQLDGNGLITTLDHVKKTYSGLTEDMPFDYGFFDETIQSWYDGEKRTAIIVSYFALLSIVISVMGIFAMSVFYNQQKIKEIGIHKVNGATVLEIVKMLNKDFVKWVAISFIIACPIAYYAMDRWLQNFPYKTTISWWIFALAGLFALAIALITISWQTFMAARRNPVDSLRYE
ncbi:MAG: ABC transporter permease [Bacteroidales bacterium]|nr:ABC transporter permease [Bacteroidales bacterium]